MKPNRSAALTPKRFHTKAQGRASRPLGNASPHVSFTPKGLHGKAQGRASRTLGDASPNLSFTRKGLHKHSASQLCNPFRVRRIKNNRHPGCAKRDPGLYHATPIGVKTRLESAPLPAPFRLTPSFQKHAVVGPYPIVSRPNFRRIPHNSNSSCAVH